MEKTFIYSKIFAIFWVGYLDPPKEIAATVKKN